MSSDDPLDLERIDQTVRINELREQANELAGGEMSHWENKDCPPDLSEAFWQHVVDYEKAPSTSHFIQLTEAGVVMPPPEEMSDEEITAKLWEMVRCLADRRVFLNQTNYLNDRELYILLWSDVLHEVTVDLPVDRFSACCIDLLSSGSDEDTLNYMRYFADEKYRADWMASFPDYEMPAHVDPPYDRDRHLPQATYGDPDDGVQ